MTAAQPSFSVVSVDDWAQAIVFGCHGRGRRAQCPCCAQNDGDRSRDNLSVSVKDGNVLVICRAGCPQQEVIAALRGLGLWPARVRKAWTAQERRQWALDRQRARRVADWSRGLRLVLEAEKARAYRDADDEALAVAARALFLHEASSHAELVASFVRETNPWRYEKVGRGDRAHAALVLQQVVEILCIAARKGGQ